MEDNEKKDKKSGYTPMSDAQAKKIRTILFVLFMVVAIVVLILRFTGVF